jgi:Domain of unknown function (DUF4411)
VPYCIDTSSLIAAWEERYPIGHFPNFWKLFEGAIENGKLSAPTPVLDETDRKSKELYEWLQDRNGLFVELDEAVQLEVKTILAKHPRLVMEKKQRYAADPFVIALAKQNSFTVVTDEKPTRALNRPNIPDVCDDYGVPCIGLLQLIKLENWIIG